jgi:Flp pilus assembly protein TadD
MLRSGQRFAGRFDVRGDEDDVRSERRILWKRIMQGWPGPPSEDLLWLPAIDIRTGAPVVVSPRGYPYQWADDQDTEALARRVMALQLPSIVPVLHVGPGVVHAAPPPAAPRPILPVAEAAECALAVCEVVAHLHALGCTDLSFGPSHLRMVWRAGKWQIAWLIPTVNTLAMLDATTMPAADIDALSDDDPSDQPGDPVVIADQRRIVRFFLARLGRTRPPEHPAITALRRGSCPDVAALARMFVPLLADPTPWIARIARLPQVRVVSQPPRDWDAIIADGEAAHTDRSDESVALALATAYHQRACRSFAAGSLQAALQDVDRALALGPYIPYRTTRALILDRLGEAAQARADIARALLAAPAVPARRDDEATYDLGDDPLSPVEHARALATRGLFALHDGDLAAAERDLRDALALHPTAAYAHALGAALYRRGDIAGAAGVEARSVELAPDDPRHRWALIVSLLRLGRDDEAQDHAIEILRRAPDDPAHRARFARLFGDR